MTSPEYVVLVVRASDTVEMFRRTVPGEPDYGQLSAVLSAVKRPRVRKPKA